jgi:hypothetical protein
VDIQRIEFEHVDLIHLGQNRPNLRALFNTVPPKYRGTLLLAWKLLVSQGICYVEFEL